MHQAHLQEKGTLFPHQSTSPCCMLSMRLHLLFDSLPHFYDQLLAEKNCTLSLLQGADHIKTQSQSYISVGTSHVLDSALITTQSCSIISYQKVLRSEVVVSGIVFSRCCGGDASSLRPRHARTRRCPISA